MTGIHTAAWLTLLFVSVGDENEIRRLESEIGRAIVQRDTAFVERVWAEEFVYTGVRGEVKSKDDLIRELEAGELRFETMKFDDVQVRLFHETAVVTGRATTVGRSAQGEIRGQFRYTRVYVKRLSDWQLVAFQGTPLAP